MINKISHYKKEYLLFALKIIYDSSQWNKFEIFLFIKYIQNIRAKMRLHTK